MNDSFEWTEQKLKRNLNSLSYFKKNLLVMKVFLLDNCRSWSRRCIFFSAPAPAKNYGSGRLLPTYLSCRYCRPLFFYAFRSVFFFTCLSFLPTSLSPLLSSYILYLLTLILYYLHIFLSTLPYPLLSIYLHIID